MNSRKEKIEELIEAIGELKRNITFCPAGIGKRASLTPSQWRALTAIELGKGATTKDLARELGITSSATTQVVDALVVNGYVKMSMMKLYYSIEMLENVIKKMKVVMNLLEQKVV